MPFPERNILREDRTARVRKARSTADVGDRRTAESAWRRGFGDLHPMGSLGVLSVPIWTARQKLTGTFASNATRLEKRDVAPSTDWGSMTYAAVMTESRQRTRSTLG